ncbi:MAG: hypothetical protein JW819_01905 [Candidatus Krumholzibacteriota bacterium]|nr:hypothetical protein [Candidatus Krumholzibacteriota bacterium]
MRPERGRTLIAVLVLALLSGCAGEEGKSARLHRAQRDFWRAKRARERLDIYPSPTLADAALAAYQSVLETYPPGDLPAVVADPEAPRVKVARVGAMACLGAAGLHWEAGRREEAIGLVRSVLRPDLPLGHLVERRLRLALASYLDEAGRPAEALTAIRSLLDPLRPGLPPEHAAYPDEELLNLPLRLADLAVASGDAALAAETEAFIRDYLARVAAGYAGEEAEWHALLAGADLATRGERWEEASSLLERLARSFPDREPWRADLARARLLGTQLDRTGEAEAILRRLAGQGRGEAAARGGIELARLLLAAGRDREAAEEMRRLGRELRHKADSAELLYLWGELERRADNAAAAVDRWRRAAAYARTPYGLEAQYATARYWAERGEARFAARALGRLFIACRHNTRYYSGGEIARLSLQMETRADSLLGTLPATEPRVARLMEQRGIPLPATAADTTAAGAER